MLTLSLVIGLLLSPVYAQDEPTDPPSRTEGFKEAYLATKDERDAFLDFRLARNQKLMGNRRDCRHDIRRSNRDTRFATILRCARTELLIKVELLEHQRESIDALPGISQSVRMEAMEATDRLSEALVAILSGIDTGIYAHEEDLIQMKKTLMSSYYTPYWQSLITVRAETLRTWVRYLSEAIVLVPTKGLSEAAVRDLVQGHRCLDTAEEALLAIGNSEGILQAKEALADAHTILQTCVETIAGARMPSRL